MMNNYAEKKEFFLATTALEDFWDTSKPIVFLSEACVRYSRSSVWKNLDCRVFESPLKDRGEFEKSYPFVRDVHERFLETLANALNSLHSIDKPVKFWRIVIGPWLMHYVHSIFERFRTLSSVLEAYPNITTIGLDENDFAVAKDFPNFMERVFSDIYNLQLYTKILHLLGKKFDRKSALITQPFSGECYKTHKQNTVKLLIKKFLKNMSPIVVKNAYFPTPVAERALIRRTKAKVFFDHNHSFSFTETPLDMPLRESLAEKIKAEKASEFEVLLSKLLAFDMPKIYLEGFSAAEQQSKRQGRRPEVIVSSDAWYFDELFKLWAANCALEGTALVGIQHGSNYGICSIIPQEEHEIKITSRFYSWGWKPDNAPNIKPMPSPRLMSHAQLAADNNKEGILFPLNCYPRYFYRYQDLRHYDIYRYFEWQRKFVRALDAAFRKKLTIRPYPATYGNEIKEELLDIDTTLVFDNPRREFMESLRQCRLCVCDCLESTFFEALAANKPTVLFWDPEIFVVRSEAAPFFKKLHESGILFYDPPDAAAAISEIYNDVGKWWLDTQRQQARNEFCDRFAVSSPDNMGLWAAEFKELLTQKKRGIL